MWQVTTAKTSKGKGKKREKSEASASAEGGAEAKKKKLKDPNAPKGKKTAFIFFQGEARQTAPFSTMSFTDAGKALGAAWKAMTEEEKAPFVAQAAQDKKRYDKEMKSYVVPPVRPKSQDPNARAHRAAPPKSQDPKPASARAHPRVHPRGARGMAGVRRRLEDQEGDHTKGVQEGDHPQGLQARAQGQGARVVPGVGVVPGPRGRSR